MPDIRVANNDIAILEAKLYLRPEFCKGCGFCVEFCPKKVLAVSAAYNSRGYHPPEVVASAACSNCKLCELLCPDFAIYSGDEEGGRA